jgi:signal transduction histidine kinase
VWIGCALDDDGEVRLWVRDQGSGIEPADLDRVFDRFSRGTSSHAIEGSGLGLSIVATIAAAHGGRMEVQSQPGSGSTFTMVLPFDEDPGSTPAEAGDLPHPEPDPDPAPKQRATTAGGRAP